MIPLDGHLPKLSHYKHQKQVWSYCQYRVYDSSFDKTVVAPQNYYQHQGIKMSPGCLEEVREKQKELFGERKKKRVGGDVI